MPTALGHMSVSYAATKLEIKNRTGLASEISRRL